MHNFLFRKLLLFLIGIFIAGNEILYFFLLSFRKSNQLKVTKSTAVCKTAFMKHIDSDHL